MNRLMDGWKKSHVCTAALCGWMGAVMSARRDWWMDGWVGGWMDGRMDGWRDRWMGGWMDGVKGGWVGGWVDGWMGGSMGGCVDARRACVTMITYTPQMRIRL